MLHFEIRFWFNFWNQTEAKTYQNMTTQQVQSPLIWPEKQSNLPKSI